MKLTTLKVSPTVLDSNLRPCTILISEERRKGIHVIQNMELGIFVDGSITDIGEIQTQAVENAKLFIAETAEYFSQLEKAKPSKKKAKKKASKKKR